VTCLWSTTTWGRSQGTFTLKKRGERARGGS